MHRWTKQKGFTIVELLIVIVVIAILAVITIVAFNGIQARARASSASSALTQAKKKLELYKVDSNAYPATGNLANAGVTDTTDVSYQYTSTGTAYCLTATNGSTSYYLNSATNTTPTAGGCAGHGQGGVAAVTNLVANPSAELAGGWLNNNGTIYTTGFDTVTKRTGARSLSSYLNTGQTSSTMLSIYAPGGADGYGAPITESGTYVAAGYFRADAANKGRMAASYRLSGTYSTTVYGDWVVGSTSGWTRATVSLSVPDGADRIRLGTNVVTEDNSMATPGVKAYADDVILVKGSDIPGYADGSTPNWVWNGTANASTSTGPPL